MFLILTRPFIEFINLSDNSMYELPDNASFCNDKQRWNNEKWRCECKELIDMGKCNKGFTWNPSKCECECDTSCELWQYLD